jgi:long-chain acyl-CoA synthetase
LAREGTLSPRLDDDLSVERGEVTPSLKVKRSVVAERNKAIIDAFYR